MKEIKFRAWDEGNKIMHYDFQFIRTGTAGNDWICFVSDKQPLMQDAAKNPFFSQQLKIMQYTGLKDFTNNIGIAEEDICKAKFKRKTVEGFEVIDVSGRIFFDDWEFMYCLITEEGEIYSCNRLHKYEVIGNVYENPELIKDNMVIEK